MKRFSLPGFYCRHNYFMELVEYYYDHSEQFYKDRIIDSGYDAFPGLLWQGGRMPNPCDPIVMRHVLNTFNNFPDIKLRHVFTNCLLDEELVKDYKCNFFVQHYIREQDEVILNHPLLIEHFKQNYPQIPIIYSTTLNIKDIDKINEITKTNIYVLNYNYNNDNEYLSKLEHRNNIEMICAEPCVPNCPNRADHYRSISQSILDIAPDKSNCRVCPYGSEYNTFAKNMTLSTAITNDRIDELTACFGIEYFKISGRTISIPMWIETILYYLALPEYRDEIRQYFLNKWW